MAFLSSLPGIIVIVFGFGVLIFVHEMGHFLAAKWAGIRTEGFAIGMGPVMASWRKGVGLALGSTERRVVARTGKPAVELSDAELREHGIGETEYSLRWLPLGGFVKMLGQDDLRPSAVGSGDRSYTACPVGKRMIVVSAGVVMNVLLAIVLFVVAFLSGVRVEAPVIGDVSDVLPAGTTVADNAAALGVTSTGLEPGDVVTFIDGAPARSFADLQIASAMGRPGVPLHLVVERSGVSEPLRFTMKPAMDPGSGLLSIGVAPASSTVLVDDGPDAPIGQRLERTGLAAAGVQPGMQVISAAGEPVATFEQLQRRFAQSGGAPVPTVWRATGADGEPAGPEIAATMESEPDFAVLRYPELADDGVRDFEFGLLGLAPLTKVERVLDDSENVGILRPGDVIVGVGDRRGPRCRDVIAEIKANAGLVIAVTVLRDGREETVSAVVSRAGRVGIEIGYAWDRLLLAEPMTRIAPALADGKAGTPVDTPIAGLGLEALTRIVAVDGTPADDWPALRAALRSAGATADGGAAVAITVEGPGTAGAPRTLELTLAAADVAELNGLAWRTTLPPYAFEPIYTTLSAEGSPLLAVRMGFLETHKMIIMTYLTIDRLFRGTVGVEQLRGPVGIIDLGSKILPRGFNFFLFFLGMISVNLAVINFLPLPIVDGGLFLFLVYEKFKGRPPSVQFQNVTTMVGLFLIGTIFVVTFYNDIMRLL